MSYSTLWNEPLLRNVVSSCHLSPVMEILKVQWFEKNQPASLNLWFYFTHDTFKYFKVYKDSPLIIFFCEWIGGDRDWKAISDKHSSVCVCVRLCYKTHLLHRGKSACAFFRCDSYRQRNFHAAAAAAAAAKLIVMYTCVCAAGWLRVRRRRTYKDAITGITNGFLFASKQARHQCIYI